MMKPHLAGKVVIVTGAGNGFGRLTALRLGAGGAKVACLDIDEAAAGAVAGAITAQGGEAIGLRADVTAIDDMHAAVAATIEAWGAVDVLVNNAGIMPLAFVADHAEALALYAETICGATKGRWRASGIDPEGMDLACGDQTARLVFDARVTHAGSLRTSIVSLAAQARG